MHKFFIYPLLATLFSVSSVGQSSRANVFVGYSLTHTDFGAGSSNFNGFEVSYTVSPRFHSQWFGLIIDVSEHFGSAPVPLAGACSVPRCVTPIISSNVRVLNSLYGVRFSRTGDKFTPFATVSIGGSSLVANGTQSYIGVNQSIGSFSYSTGAGANYRFSRRFGWRVQGDFLQTHFSGNFQNYARFSTGPVVYFGLRD